MKYFLILLLIIPFSSFAIVNQDLTNQLAKENSSVIQKNSLLIDSLKHELKKINKDYEYQLRINEQTLTSISRQIEATSFNFTIFGILFAIAALGLGVYITFIERKTVSIRGETQELLRKTNQTKEEVEKINELIQKDIYGLFLKIKREETVHILKRLLKVPEDISNLLSQLLSRELENEDFQILKEAYLKLKPQPKVKPGFIRVVPNYKDGYKLLFFQHFLDLSLLDEVIGPDLIDFYPQAIESAFENDIIKSSQDFIRAIIDKGVQKCEKEINSFILGISKSDFKENAKLYEILFNSLSKRENQFKFFDLITTDKEARIGKVKYGILLRDNYFGSEMTESEKISLGQLSEIESELKVEEQKRIEEEKRRKAEEEQKRKIEENRKAKETKK